MEKIKKLLHYLSSMVLYALLMILVVVVSMVVITIGDRAIALKNHESKAPLFSAYVIISPSMVPNINVYDAVITARVSQNKIGMYDIITFLSKEIDTHGVPITHRVVGILKTENGEKAYRTKGDNNNKEDKAIIRQSEVIGKVLFRIPMLGYVRTFVTSKIGFLISVVLPIAASLFLEIWRFIHRRKERLQEQKENQVEVLEPDSVSSSLQNVENVESVSTVSPATVSSPTITQTAPVQVQSPPIVPSPSPVNSTPPKTSPPPIKENPSSDTEFMDEDTELLDLEPLTTQHTEPKQKKSADDDDIEVI